MKKMKLIFIAVTAAIFFMACDQNTGKIHLNDPLDAGREFIDASLKGDYDVARKYLLVDSTNLVYFNMFTEFYKKKPEEEKEGYKDANIIINSTENVSDSVKIIYYTNTFKNKPSKIKLVKRNNEWLVDFKYTFIEN